MMNFDSPWCEGNDLTYAGTDEDGTQHWHCNLCGGSVSLTRLRMTATSSGMYNHWKPGREPVEIPQAFLKAFGDGEL